MRVRMRMKIRMTMKMRIRMKMRMVLFVFDDRYEIVVAAVARASRSFLLFSARKQETTAAAMPQACTQNPGTAVWGDTLAKPRAEPPLRVLVHEERSERIGPLRGARPQSPPSPTRKQRQEILLRHLKNMLVHNLLDHLL